MTTSFPAGDLPDAVRQHIDPAHRVTVIVLEETQPAVTDFETKMAKYWGIRAERGTTIEEAVARVRTLRDEWDDR